MLNKEQLFASHDTPSLGHSKLMNNHIIHTYCCGIIVHAWKLADSAMRNPVLFLIIFIFLSTHVKPPSPFFVFYFLFFFQFFFGPLSAELSEL